MVVKPRRRAGATAARRATATAEGAERCRNIAAGGSVGTGKVSGEGLASLVVTGNRGLTRFRQGNPERRGISEWADSLDYDLTSRLLQPKGRFLSGTSRCQWHMTQHVTPLAINILAVLCVALFPCIILESPLWETSQQSPSASVWTYRKGHWSDWLSAQNSPCARGCCYSLSMALTPFQSEQLFN